MRICLVCEHYPRDHQFSWTVEADSLGVSEDPPSSQTKPLFASLLQLLASASPTSPLSGDCYFQSCWASVGFPKTVHSIWHWTCVAVMHSTFLLWTKISHNVPWHDHNWREHLFTCESPLFVVFLLLLPRGHRKLKKRPYVYFGGKLGWEIDIWRSEGQEIRIEWDIGEIKFRGNNFFFFFLLDLLRHCASFSNFFGKSFGLTITCNCLI